MRKMRRDPEAVAAYRKIFAEHGVDVSGESDELVIERMERAMGALLAVGRGLHDAMKQLAAVATSMARAMRPMVELGIKLDGAALAEEAAMDLKLRDEVGLDVRLLELHDAADDA